jgi:glucose-6-phosphate isomerase
MNYTDFDKTESYKKLLSLAGKKFDYSLLDSDRVGSSNVPMAGGLTYNWAAKAADSAVLAALASLAGEQELTGKYKALLDGETMNTGEGRKVLHQLLRGQLGKAVIHEGRDLGEFYRKELERFSAFADSVRGGALKGSTGKPFKNAVQIGIGGSDLGPRALYIALDNWAQKN